MRTAWLLGFAALVFDIARADSICAQHGVLEGVVEDADGMGIAGASVFALPPFNNGLAKALQPPVTVCLTERTAWPEASATTDATGGFRIAGLDPEEGYLVFALTASGALSTCVQALPGPDGIRLSTAPQPTVAVAVQDADGEPLLGASVVVRMKLALGWSESVALDPLEVPGLYELSPARRLVEGDWIAQVLHPNHSVGYTPMARMGGTEGWTGSLSLEPDRAVFVALPRLEPGAAPPAVRVLEFLPSPETDGGLFGFWPPTHREHSFELEGRESVEIRTSQGSALEAQLLDRGRILAEAKAEPNEDRIVLVLPDRYPLSGSVEGRETLPGSEVVVVAVSVERSPGSLRLDADRLSLVEPRHSYATRAERVDQGRLEFEIPDLPVGTYRVLAMEWPPNSRTHALSIGAGSDPPGCILWEHSRADRVRLMAPGSMVIEGETLFEGERVGKIEVQLFSTGSDDVRLQTMVSDPGGCFRFDPVPFGSYRVRAFSSRFLCPSVALVDGVRTDPAAITLSFGTLVGGVLTDEAGVGIPKTKICIVPRLDRSLEELPGIYTRKELASYHPGEPHGIESALSARGGVPWKHFGTTTTDEEGRFLAVGVPFGPCFAEAYLPDGRIVRWPVRIENRNERIRLQVRETGKLFVRLHGDTGLGEEPNAAHVRLLGEGAELSAIDNPAHAVASGRLDLLSWPRMFEDLQPGRYAVDYLHYDSSPEQGFRVLRTVQCWVRSGEVTDVR